MKLYATVTSERASKGQGGNNFLDVSIQLEKADKTRLVAGTVNVYNDKENDRYIITVYPLAGDKREKFSWTVTKGEKQKGDYHKCKKHEERTRECKFYSFQNDPCSEI